MKIRMNHLCIPCMINLLNIKITSLMVHQGYGKEMVISLIYESFLPDRLAELRIQKGISARDMSLSLGQANNYINTIENKKSLPSMQSFFYICEFLDITPQEFFDTGNSNPKKLKEFIDEAKKLDPESFSHILGIMKELNKHK